MLRELVYREGEWVPDEGTDRGDYIFFDEAEWMRRAEWYHKWSWYGLIKMFFVIMVVSFIVTSLMLSSVGEFLWEIYSFVLFVCAILFVVLSMPVYLFVRWKVSLIRRRLAIGRKVPALYEHGLEVPKDEARDCKFIPYSEVCRLKRQEGVKSGPVADWVVGKEVWYSMFDSEDRYIEAVADVWASKEGLLMLQRIANKNLRTAPPDLVVWGQDRT
jgi:hypothetical protein